MTTDLEKTLGELGPDYCRLVTRLRTCEVPQRPRFSGVYLQAAALAILLFLPCLFIGLSRSYAPSVRVKPASAPRDYCLAQEATPDAIAELVRTQHPDGSWANDFLTRRNAEALKNISDPSAQLAYRKAMRNLRVRAL